MMEQRKMVGTIGSALAIMATLSGIVLMATQIGRQGAGFFVGYLLYALAILGGGMFIAWIPKMVNHRYGPTMVDGKMKWTKFTNVVDEKRTRLIWWPLITFFFELYGIFSFCNDLWPSDVYSVLQTVFGLLTLLLFVAWVATTIKSKKRQA